MSEPTIYVGSFNWRNVVANEDKAEKTPKPKRRMKQTMREKTTQTATQANKPSRTGKVLRVIAKPFRPIGRALARVERIKPIHFIGLIIVPRYFRNSWKELRQVSWPNGKESRRLTFAVMIFATVFGVLIALTDYGLDKVFKKVILKQ